ncbi:glutamate cyclase domain-containing protein [Rhizobium sp. ZPR3]|uniref:Glutamate cyclase domain-containing protein n=2 Tax=unclassified Rhizobium TaxID=2613769 RepID=A0AAU7SQG9_9HYPH
MSNYFSYLNVRPTAEALKERFGRELDKLMTLDFNLGGRTAQLYALERAGSNHAGSTDFAAKLVSSVGAADIAILVTGWSVRPHIDVSIGEVDGPPGAAAIARALFLARGCASIVVTAKPLVSQTAAAFRAAGAVVVNRDAIHALRGTSTKLFAVAVEGFELDCDLDDQFRGLLSLAAPRVALAVEHFGFAADGNAYLSTGTAISRGVLHTDTLFLMAAEQGALCGACVDNPNEAGTARLHNSLAKHPPMKDDFENILVGSSANMAAYALAAAIGGLAGRPDAAFTGRLDEAAVAATFANGAIDPFSGSADPISGVDTLEPPYHTYVTDLMARMAHGYCNAMSLVA